LLTGFETSLLAAQTPKIPAAERDLASKTLPWRTEFLDGGQSGLKTASATGGRKSGTIPGENPHRNGLSRVGAGICGFAGLDGGGCSRAKPVGDLLTGNFLKNWAQNRLLTKKAQLHLAISRVLAVSCTGLSSLSCYSVEQAVYAQDHIIQSATSGDPYDQVCLKSETKVTTPGHEDSSL
jgi:hypothetical protein